MKKHKLMERNHVLEMAQGNLLEENRRLRSELEAARSIDFDATYDDMKKRLFELSTQVCILKREKSELIEKHQKAIDKVCNALGTQAVDEALRETP